MCQQMRREEKGKEEEEKLRKEEKLNAGARENVENLEEDVNKSYK